MEERRYIVCHNEDQAKKDQADREAIVAALRDQLRQGAKFLVGNKGYRKFLKTRSRGGFEIDEAKIESEARFDGKWVLQTDTELTTAECALKYKELWMVEQLFRSMNGSVVPKTIRDAVTAYSAGKYDFMVSKMGLGYPGPRPFYLMHG